MDILRIEHELIPVVSQMETTGVAIDTELLERTKRELEGLKAGFADEILSHSSKGLNINSNEQLSRLLFQTLGIPPMDQKIGKNGSHSVNRAHLSKLRDRHPIIPKILDYRKASKLLDFCGQLGKLHPKTGRLHASFNQIGTETGRFSSSRPNLQNIPNRKIETGETDGLKVLESNFRRMFVAKKRHRLICADYSQIELRVMAEFSQDPFLLKAYTQGIDIHRLTAAQVFGIEIGGVGDQQRSVAKSINFGLIYGSTEFGLADSLTKITSRPHSAEEARKIMAGYFEKFAGVSTCLDRLVEQADNNGYSSTLFGRRRPIPQLQSNEMKVREAGKRMAMNSPIQGTAADIIKMAMVNCHRKIQDLGLRSRMVLQVHDELVFEVPSDEEEAMVGLVKKKMEGAVRLSVPLEVDLKVAENWADAH